MRSPRVPRSHLCAMIRFSRGRRQESLRSALVRRGPCAWNKAVGRRLSGYRGTRKQCVTRIVDSSSAIR